MIIGHNINSDDNKKHAKQAHAEPVSPRAAENANAAVREEKKTSVSVHPSRMAGTQKQEQEEEQHASRPESALERDTRHPRAEAQSPAQVEKSQPAAPRSPQQNGIPPIRR